MEIAAGELKLKRSLDCSDSNCHENKKEKFKRFYSPYSLSINKDGQIFIADYNCIWMFNNTEEPRKVLNLRY